MSGLDGLRGLWRERFGRETPEKIVCVGLNYHDHAAEQGAELPAEPLLFAKFAMRFRAQATPSSSRRRAPTWMPRRSSPWSIGAEGRRVSEDDALGLVAGYTVANDVTARDLQSRDGQWLRAKGFDSFCPLLPAIVPVSDLGDGSGLRIVQRLNGEPLQDSSTSELIFGVPRLVAHASSVFTLRPGDVILTGTPAGVGVHRNPPVALAPGDTVEIQSAAIGVLSNPVTS
jgi:2-keto-4-pentenoate hydratase/2-oxohepta-3-ene-1,7-dioic acid hydratase in catechol pathway